MSTPTRETLAARLRTLRDDIECAGRISPSLDGLLRQAADALAAMAWQPIETAPKDGTLILAITDAWIDRRPTVIEWSDRPNGRFCWNDTECTYDPTHWQPLPPPPTGAAPERTEREG